VNTNGSCLSTFDDKKVPSSNMPPILYRLALNTVSIGMDTLLGFHLSVVA